MNYKVRDNSASKIGYSRENMALANWNKNDLQGKLLAATNNYDDAVRDLEHFENSADKSSPTYQQQYQDKVNKINELRAQKQNLEVLAGKAEKNAKTIEDRRAQLGAGPTIYSDVLFDKDSDGKYRKRRSQYRDNYTVVDSPKTDENGFPLNVPENFTTDSSAFNPLKGQSGSSAGGNTNVVDDSILSSSGGTGAAGGHGGHH